MPQLKNILSKLLSLLVLSTFLISTTGFTSFEHHCTHHETVSTVLPESDGCCSTAKVIEDVRDDNCCPDKHCGTEEDYSNCCTDELSYHRLSEWFTPTDTERDNLTCKTIFLMKDPEVVQQKTDPDIKVVKRNHEIHQFSSSPPKYIIYHQFKLDPPLI